MNHALIGAGIPFLIALLIYSIHGARAGWRLLTLTPVAMAVGIVWSLVPDIPLIFGSSRWYSRIHQSAWIDVFFWHGYIDRVEKQIALAPWNQMVMVLMGVALLVIVWRELTVEENGKKDLRP